MLFYLAVRFLFIWLVTAPQMQCDADLSVAQLEGKKLVRLIQDYCTQEAANRLMRVDFRAPESSKLQTLNACQIQVQRWAEYTQQLRDYFDNCFDNSTMRLTRCVS
jgi:hypothetical protein